MQYEQKNLKHVGAGSAFCLDHCVWLCVCTVPGYSRDDIHMGRRSPASTGIARPSTTCGDVDARLRINPATPASGTVPHSSAGSEFPGLSRGHLNPTAGKAASPLAAASGPAAGSNLRPGKDPGRL